MCQSRMDNLMHNTQEEDKQNKNNKHRKLKRWATQTPPKTGDRSKCSTVGLGQFHTHIRVCVVLIVEDPSMTVKCRTTINSLFIYFTLSPRVMLNSISSTSIPLLTESMYFDKTITTIRNNYFENCVFLLCINMR
jgi:hypothetical protein